MENYPDTSDFMLDPRKVIRDKFKAKYQQFIVEKNKNNLKFTKIKLRRGKHVGIFKEINNF